MKDFEFFVGVLTTLIVVIDPFAILPIYVSLTKDYSPLAKRRIRHRTLIVAFVVLMVFTIFSENILLILHISLPSVQISGGLLLLFFAFRELFFSKRETPAQVEEGFNPDVEEDVGTFPLAIPLIAGPGALSTIAVYRSEATNFNESLLILFAVLLVLFLAHLVLRYSDLILKVISNNTLHLATKIANLILVAMATEIFLSGIKLYLKTLAG